MYDNDYVILFDENGQPYIAHSVWGKVRSGAKSAYGAAKSAAGRGTRAVHKYILKIGEGAKAQYAYTKEEADRLLGRGKQKVQQTVDKAKSAARDATGLTARDTRDKASAAYETAKKNAEQSERDYEEARKKTADAERAARIASINYGGASRTEYERKKLYDAALNKYIDDDNSKIKKLQRALRKGEQNAHAEDLQKAVDLYDDRINSYIDKENAARELDRANRSLSYAKDSEADYAESAKASKQAADDAKNSYVTAQAKYMSTPIHKIDNIVNDFGQGMTDLAQDAKAAASSAKEKASEVKEITASQARKLQEKLASGKELAQNEINQLMTFLMKGYK